LTSTPIEPVDLQPERSAQVVEQWLKEHPGVEVITRDRSNEYADGASRGAPDAVQVADRFHLLQNVREMLQRVLERHQAALQAATTRALTGEPLTTTSTPGASSSTIAEAIAEPPALTALRLPHHRPSRRSWLPARSAEIAAYAQYQKVQELRAQGLSYRAIAAQLHLSRQTVRRYSVADAFPERATRSSKSAANSIRLSPSWSNGSLPVRTMPSSSGVICPDGASVYRDGTGATSS
jgi:transposase